MRKYLFLLVIFVIKPLIFPSLFANTDTSWVRTYSNPAIVDTDYARAMVVDNSGYIYVTGASKRSSINYDVATIKYKPNGDTAWVRRENIASSNDFAKAITVDGSGNVYVTGMTIPSGGSYDYLTIKYDLNGTCQWRKIYDGPVGADDVANAIVVDGSGYVYVTGYSAGSATSLDYATVKYNSNGILQWAARYNGPANLDDRAYAMTLRSDTVYVTGASEGSGTDMDYLTIKYHPNGDEIWTRRYNNANFTDEASAIAVDVSGSVCVTGKSLSTSQGYNYVTVKYYATGTQYWVQPYNYSGSNLDIATAIALDGSNNVYVTGYSGPSSNYDYATIRYSPTGSLQWVSRYTGQANDEDRATAIAVSGSNVYVTGYSTGSGTLFDYATVKYSASNGYKQWEKRYDNAGGNDIANAIAVRSDTVYVTGESYGSSTSVDYATIKYRVVKDVATTAIIFPSGTIDSTNTITPSASIKNNGSEIETFNATFKIDGWANTATVSNLPPDSVRTVPFSAWTVGPRGNYTTRCSTYEAGDEAKLNDTLSGSVTIRVRDYTAKSISSPTSPVDSGSTITPKAWIRNNGTVAESDSVKFYIVGTSYTSTKDVSLIAGDSTEISFDPLPLNIPRNTYTMRCTTRLTGDLVPGNNRITGSLSLTVHDYAATQITAPTSPVDSGTAITPKAWIYNNGTGSEADSVKFYIVGTSYTNTKYVSLIAGNSIEQSFDAFILNIPRGSYTMRCTTKLGTDMVGSNNLATGLFSIKVQDYAVTSISAPTSPVDSGSTITPKAWILNNGTTDKTDIPVTFYIVGTTYSSTKLVSLTSGNSTEQVFDDFVLNIPRSTYTMRCTTQLDGDLVVNNNLMTSPLSIQVRDYAAVLISEPTSPIDSGSTITPKALIYNYGTTKETDIPVTLYIVGTTYSSTKLVSLDWLGGYIEQVFDNFIINLPRGNYEIRCTTQLDADMVVNNNLTISLVKVQVLDYAATLIASPLGLVDSSMTITPKARIHNYGTTDETYIPVTFYIIGTTYSNTKLVSLNHGESVEQEFDDFVVNIPRGIYTMRCTTQLTNDLVAINDFASSLLELRVADAGVMEIIEPNGDVDSTSVIIPRVRVKNFGTHEATFNVTVRIGSWSSTKEVSALIPDNEEQVSFNTAWTVGYRGGYAIKCSTELSDDMVTDNDKVNGSFNVIVRDYATTGITVPAAPVYSGDTVIPKAWIHNYGTQAETDIPVTFYIEGTSYSSTKNITLGVDESIEQSFDTLFVNFSDNTYIMRCSTKLNNDTRADNNLTLDTLYVRIIGWVKMKDVTVLQTNKGIGEGGSLVVVADTIYALQGANTRVFCAYYPALDTWISKCSIPRARNSDGRLIGKNVNYGGALATKDGLIYALKGNNTNEFWMYNPHNDSWTQKHSVLDYMPGSTRKTYVKTGGALVAAADSIYAFKGGNTRQFWVYDIPNDTWYPRESLVLHYPDYNKKINAGAALTAKGCTIYAFVGNNTNYFYSYICGQDTWIKKADVFFGSPLTLNKKVKDGASLVYKDGKVYALKGNNTRDFGCYDIARDTWLTRDIIPVLQKVKAGGALVIIGPRIYAFMGGKTRAFWRYTPSPVLQVDKIIASTQNAVMAEIVNTQMKPQLKVLPNPFTKQTTIRYTVPISGKISLKLYNAAGRLVETLINGYINAGSYSFKIENWKLNISKGIYFLKYSSTHDAKEIKLIIE